MAVKVTSISIDPKMLGNPKSEERAIIVNVFSQSKSLGTVIVNSKPTQ